MNKLFFVKIIICFVIIFISSFCSSSIADTVDMTINAAGKIGPIPDLLSPSIWIANSQRFENRYILSKFLSENQPTVIQLTLRTLRHSKNFADFQRRLVNYLKLESVQILLKKIKEYNTTLIVGFETASVPRWLSSRPGNLAKPFSDEDWTVEQSSSPSDYNQWGNIVKFTLRSFIEKFDLKNLGFFVGHEPDGFWFGDEKNFFKYYEYAARAAKRVNENIIAGGIGTQSVMQKKKTCFQYSPAVKSICRGEKPWADPGGSPMLKNFIFYVAKHNVPLDFINWHSFNVLPTNLQKQADTIRQWLIGSGLDPNNIILYPSDWSYWSWYAGGYPADYLDTEEAAAYAIHALYHMWQGGIQWHGHDFDIDNYSFEEQRIKQRQNAAFIGDWRILTRNGIIKPIYNAFRALDMLSLPKHQPPSMIEAISPPHSTLVAIPVLKGNTIYVLMSNFTPIEPSTLDRYMFEKTRQMMSFVEDEIQNIRECVKTKTVDKKSLGQHLQACKNEISSRINDPQKREALDFLAEIFKCNKLGNSFSSCLQAASEKLNNPHNQKIANKLKRMEIDSTRSLSVKIHFENLPLTGNAELITYTIDSNSSNACKYNKRTEPSPTESSCGIGGEVDQALQNIRNNARRKTVKTFTSYLRSKGYSQDYVNKLINDITNCDTNIHTCFQRVVKDEARKSPRQSARIKQDFRQAAENSIQTYYTALYYDPHYSINSLNAHDEIALDGSKKTTVVKVKNGRYSFELEMQMNSVWLLVLQPDNY